MPVPLLDLKPQYDQIRDLLEPKLRALLESQRFILGPVVEDFEKRIAGFIGCGHAVGMSSGTDAFLAILMALGIGRGDAVITTPYTFFATAGCIHRVGAEVVFVDIEPESFNMDPKALEQALSGMEQGADGLRRTTRGNIVRAIVPVHLFGQCCRMDEINALAEKYGVRVVEDAAQAIGAEYPSANGVRQAGALSSHAYFSFFPSKNLGGFGDGGLAVCDDEAFAARLRAMRNHGMVVQYHHEFVGGNFRLDALQALVLATKLPFLEEWIAQRRSIAQHYTEFFSAPEFHGRITPPRESFADDEGLRRPHVYHQYVIRAAERDALKQHLDARGIGNAIYYPVPLHLQECFVDLGLRVGDMPESEKAARETLALPVYPGLTDEQIEEVTGAIAEFVRR